MASRKAPSFAPEVAKLLAKFGHPLEPVIGEVGES